MIILSSWNAKRWNKNNKISVCFFDVSSILNKLFTLNYSNSVVTSFRKHLCDWLVSLEICLHLVKNEKFVLWKLINSEVRNIFLLKDGVCPLWLWIQCWTKNQISLYVMSLFMINELRNPMRKVAFPNFLFPINFIVNMCDCGWIIVFYFDLAFSGIIGFLGDGIMLFSFTSSRSSWNLSLILGSLDLVLLLYIVKCQMICLLSIFLTD